MTNDSFGRYNPSPRPYQFADRIFSSYQALEPIQRVSRVREVSDIAEGQQVRLHTKSGNEFLWAVVDKIVESAEHGKVLRCTIVDQLKKVADHGLSQHSRVAITPDRVLNVCVVAEGTDVSGT